MGSRAFRFTVITYYYLACILCRDALGGSTAVPVFASINDAYSRPTTDAGTDDTTQDMRIERSIETRTGSDGIIPWNYRSLTTQDPLPITDLSARTGSTGGFKNEGCSRYCIQQLGTGEDRSFQDINLFWSFAGNESTADILSLENSSKLKILRRTSADGKGSTTLDDACQIYLNLGCDTMKTEDDSNDQSSDRSGSDLESNRESDGLRASTRRSVSKFSKRLLHRANLSGHTETKFHVDANVTGIVVDVWGNLTRAVLAIPASRTTLRPGITMSLARTYDAKGVAIGARNPPPGGWCVKLTGLENAKYEFDVTARFDADGTWDDTWSGIIDVESSARDDKTDDDFARSDKEHATQIEATTTIIRIIERFDEIKERIRDDTADDRIDSTLPTTSSNVNKEPKLVHARSADITEAARDSGDGETIEDDFPRLPPPSPGSTENIVNDSVLRNNPSTGYAGLKIPRNASSARMTLDGGPYAPQQRETIQARSSEVASLNEDLDTNAESFASYNASAKMANDDPSQVISAKSIDGNREDVLGQKKILIELNSNSNLLAAPGNIHRIVFDVTNNCFLVVRYEVRARSSPFGVYNIQPRYTWLYPGQTNRVAVDIFVPAEANRDTVNTLTVSIGGTQISEKTVYIYVRDAFSKTMDDVKPTIEYSFNNNCAGKLNKDRCDKTFWSADVTVQDYDSGLKTVTSSPNKIYPHTEFISGTKDRLTFHYLSTCCSTTARITAVDVSNNQYSRTIDVTEWNNLSEGEIAAITVGALFLLLLLILLIIAIVYCVRRRNSQDLPYTQRYGSRPPARSERTSF